MMKTFIGRKNELSQLEALSKSGRSTLAVIKGRRRIGKSRLAAEFAKGKIFLSFSGLAPVDGITAQEQRDIFARQFLTQFRSIPMTFTDWFDAFMHLTEKITDEPTVILLDEISWMGSMDPTFLPKIKLWWDSLSEVKANVTLLLCGSVSTWIEDNIINSTAFFGRISLRLTLRELPLPECALFLKSRGIQASTYDIFKILSITGGVPWYLEQIQSEKTIDESIKRLCFSPTGLLVDEFRLIFHDLFDQRGSIYTKIVRSLANGMRDYTQLREELGYGHGGTLSPYLGDLITSGYVTEHKSWSIKTKQAGRKSLYRLSDNYVRFYLKVIEPQLEKIHKNAFEEISLSGIAGWSSFVGLQVENLILNNRACVLKALGIHPQDIVADNPFIQRATKTQEGLQIDYLVQTQTNTLYLCECKTTRNEISTDIIGQVQAKMDKFILPRKHAISPALIYLGDVSDALRDSGFFYRMIDVADFLEI